MARNVGLIKISGKIGDLQFFTKDGKTYVGLSSNLSKDRILKDPAYKRTRENMAEFGGAANVSKAIRSKLLPLSSLIEKNLHNRLTAKIRELINSGSGVRGKRKVEFSLLKEDLVEFEINDSSLVSQICKVERSITSNADRNQVTLVFPEFQPIDALSIPEGATHFRVHLACLAVSDFVPYGANKKYKALVAAQHGLLDYSLSAPILVDDPVSAGLTLSVALPGNPVLDPKVSLFVFFGIEFLQEVNGEFYQFSTNNAIRIEAII